MAAVSNSLDSVVALLLSHKADPNIRDNVRNYSFIAEIDMGVMNEGMLWFSIDHDTVDWII